MLNFPPKSPIKIYDESWDIEGFIFVFQKLSSNIHPNNRLDEEKQKLNLYRRLESKITSEVLCQSDITSSEEAKGDSPLKFALKILFYYFLILFGLLQDIAGSYLFGNAVFSLIPGISTSALFIASITYTILDSILFYAFEVSFLKEALGLPYATDEASQLIETYSQQLKVVISMNQALSIFTALNIENKQYDRYIDMIKLLNQDLRNKDLKMGCYQESLLKKILKFGVITFGALSSIAASCFWAQSLIEVWMASLVGTTWALGFTALVITAGLGYYFSMSARGMGRLVNPDYDSFQSLKEELALFRKTYPDDLKMIQRMKHAYVMKPTMDADTQTDLTIPVFFSSRLTFFEDSQHSMARNDTHETGSRTALDPALSMM